MRIGFGFDVHQLSSERPLWLGGILIPAEKGALGHSDADVLLHAICDAILGALALGDIGKHFPDTDAGFKNIDSKILLERVIELIGEKGYTVVNIDSTLVLEKPKIMPYVEQMRACIADICKIGIDDVSVKATTNEKMGFIGRQEGVTAYAVVLLSKTN
ncbi:MAG: 2-C-methyl-D-erythritol 2,4-cyclodiphosphate synthase [Bacteroidia bacterium]|jgi:2-C-methyl-D-erythritol 2,4-cyclodiphosphate synthase|nr:2-C-methyl-D-erythritol 2,4-cyclodiphosphate synthase [Bacteroidia bacterium]